MQLPGALLGLSSLNFFLKNLFRKSFFYFVKKAFLIFGKRKLSYFFLKKVFVIFRESYIQNPIIFRTLPHIYDGTFCKNSYLSHFSAWTCLKSKAQLIEVTEQQNMTNKNDLSNLQTRWKGAKKVLKSWNWTSIIKNAKTRQIYAPSLSFWACQN